jgi:hypothetical protein
MQAMIAARRGLIDLMQVFELVKNSLRAVNDKYQDSDDLPPSIRVVVAEGGEDVTIKVCRMSADVRMLILACGCAEGLNNCLKTEQNRACYIMRDCLKMEWNRACYIGCCTKWFYDTMGGLCAAQ